MDKLLKKPNLPGHCPVQSAEFKLKMASLFSNWRPPLARAHHTGLAWSRAEIRVVFELRRRQICVRRDVIAFRRRFVHALCVQNR